MKSSFCNFQCIRLHSYFIFDIDIFILSTKKLQLSTFQNINPFLFDIGRW